MGKALKSYAEWRLQESLKEYNFYFKKYKRLIMSLFKWTNLPDGISERFIEDKLFNNGILIFFKSDMGFYVVSQASSVGLNDYEEPTGYHAISVNKIHQYVKSQDCVPIWNDMFMESNAGNVNFFAKRLSNIQKTFDINLEQLKNPYIISCPEGQRTTVKQVLKEKSDGVPYIITSDDFNDMVHINVFNLNIQNHTKELQDVKNSIINEGLTFFGIGNVDVLKRERLTSAEGEQNDDQISLNRTSMFKARQKAVDEINKKFNLNIKVEISPDISSELERFIGGDSIQ
jgi:hypothetical protein